MLPKTLILVLILTIVVCCFSAELPRNAYLPPFLSFQRPAERITAEEASYREGPPLESEPLGRYAPIFLDFPALQSPLRQQQEYALDLPFEEK
ncbi:hypothetical protein KR026_002993, partial [Drosophila bipectinata]